MEIYKISNNLMKRIEYKELKKEKGEKYWIIGTPDEVHNHNEFFRFHESTLEECKSQRQHPRLEIYEGFTFGVLNMIEWVEHRFEAKELNFYLTENYLVFVTRERNAIVEEIKKELEQSSKVNASYTINASKIIYMLLDKLTSMDNVNLKNIEYNIAKLEEQVMEGIEKDFTRDIVQLRKQLLYLKRYYEPLIDIAEGLEENENGLIDESAVRFFAILVNRMERLNNNVINLRDYVTQVRDAYQAQVDIKLNKTMKFFTVVTTIFLPLTLIAGWYGMNFKFMPELGWVMGYPFVIGLSIAVVVICLIYFKRHNYM
ncbi:MAG: magnesium transporter [Clostridia bacterium]|jgi:magnesium transporter|nr:magnesium transporter [Clostridia bacterium]